MVQNVYGIDWMNKLNNASAPAAVSTLQAEMIQAQSDIDAVEAVDDEQLLEASALKGGNHSATAGEAIAGEATDDCGREDAILVACSVWRANVDVTGDAVCTIALGIVSVADGSTYSVTEGDVIRWIVL